MKNKGLATIEPKFLHTNARICLQLQHIKKSIDPYFPKLFFWYNLGVQLIGQVSYAACS